MIAHFNPFNPHESSPTLRYIVGTTAIVSIVLAIWESFFVYLFDAPALTPLLTLSLRGIENFYVWQLLTYVFIVPASIEGLSVFYLLSLAISLYLLWILGNTIYERCGKKLFLQLFITSTLTAGLCGLLMTKVFGLPFFEFAGPTPPILALFTVWTFLYPEAELLLFFVIPARTKWLFLGVLVGMLLISIGQINPVGLAYYFGSVFSGYAFSCLALGVGSPFGITHFLDRKLIAWGSRSREGKVEKKVIDIKTGEPKELDDEAFIDEVLQKIATKGRDSLTKEESNRLDIISKKNRYLQ